MWSQWWDHVCSSKETDWNTAFVDMPDIPLVSEKNMIVRNIKQLFGFAFVEYLYQVIVTIQGNQMIRKEGLKWQELTIPKFKTWLGLPTMELVHKKRMSDGVLGNPLTYTNSGIWYLLLMDWCAVHTELTLCMHAVFAKWGCVLCYVSIASATGQILHKRTHMGYNSCNMKEDALILNNVISIIVYFGYWMYTSSTKNWY